MSAFRNAAFAATMSFAALGGTALSPAFAEMTVEVGGAPMYPSKNIIENAVNSKDHTTLVAAVKAADLVDTLQGDGPFTVFAPVNKAFDKLPKGTVEILLKPENKAGLTAVLTYHVIPGKISAADFVAAVKKGGGEAMLQDRRGRGADREAERPQTRDHRRQGRQVLRDDRRRQPEERRHSRCRYGAPAEELKR